jgi:hypothetical protein
MAKLRKRVQGTIRRTKFERLVEAGVVPNPQAFSEGEAADIEELLSEADVDALVRIKLNLGPRYAEKRGEGPGQLIIF